MSKEAMKLALEALELNNDEWKSLADSGDSGYWKAEDQDHYQQTNKAITAVREALADQPAQQEQGDSICQEDDGCPTELAVLQRFWRGQSIPYEHYPTWCKPAPVPEPCKHEPVDSEEKAGAYMEARLWEFIDMAAAWPKASPDPRTWNHVVVYAPKPAQQEPVAWRELCRRLYVELFHCDRQMMAARDEEGEPMWQQGATVRDVLADAKAALETSPPAQRTWVGLTRKEWMELGCRSAEEVRVAMTIEAKLKEKNNG